MRGLYHRGERHYPRCDGLEDRTDAEHDASDDEPDSASPEVANGIAEDCTEEATMVELTSDDSRNGQMTS